MLSCTAYCTSEELHSPWVNIKSVSSFPKVLVFNKHVILTLSSNSRICNCTLNSVTTLTGLAARIDIIMRIWHNNYKTSKQLKAKQVIQIIVTFTGSRSCRTQLSKYHHCLLNRKHITDQETTFQLSNAKFCTGTPKSSFVASSLMKLRLIHTHCIPVLGRKKKQVITYRHLKVQNQPLYPLLQFLKVLHEHSQQVLHSVLCSHPSLDQLL
jgi:hypothetical protein